MITLWTLGKSSEFWELKERTTRISLVFWSYLFPRVNSCKFPYPATQAPRSPALRNTPTHNSTQIINTFPRCSQSKLNQIQNIQQQQKFITVRTNSESMNRWRNNEGMTSEGRAHVSLVVFGAGHGGGHGWARGEWITITKWNSSEVKHTSDFCKWMWVDRLLTF